jgi:hypothetical protein
VTKDKSFQISSGLCQSFLPTITYNLQSDIMAEKDEGQPGYGQCAFTIQALMMVCVIEIINILLQYRPAIQVFLMAVEHQLNDLPKNLCHCPVDVYLMFGCPFNWLK